MLQNSLLSALRAACTPPQETDEMVRLCQKNLVGIRCDKLGEVLWISWYHQRKPSKAERESFSQFAHEVGCSSWHLAVMENRGSGEAPFATSISSLNAPQEWRGVENGRISILKRTQGRSSGIFLDQRTNRDWVQSHSAGKRVLNLFCYAGQFSVAALKGGALEVVSVDTSKQALEWTRENLVANNLSLEPSKLIAEDARVFLSTCVRQQRTFDLVICDPPSFARNKKKVFSLKKEFRPLLVDLLSVLEPCGHLLFSSNLESWRRRDFLRNAQSVMKDFKNITLTSPPAPAMGSTPAEQEPLLKTLVFQNGKSQRRPTSL